MRKTISVIFGTRPEAIKLAPVIQELRNEDSIDCIVCITAQHRGMLDEVLEIFSIEPDVDLDLMRPNQGLADLSGRALRALDEYIKRVSPDLVLVQGDTTTTFCAALAAFYNQVSVGHVEAGLRTQDLAAPWPEEGNRQLTSRLAALHFAPTEINRDNLIREGVDQSRVFVTGNPVIDALLQVTGRGEQEQDDLKTQTPDSKSTRSERPVVLITAHRRESFGEPLESVCRAILRLAVVFSQYHFVYSVHPNPNVTGMVERMLGPYAGDNLSLIEPVGYLAFVKLMASAKLILTDSGGIQEEAPSLGVPVLLLRGCTERPEGITAGATKIVGTDEDRIVEAFHELLPDGPEYRKMAQARNPYGDGQANRRIVKECVGFLRG